MNGLSMSSPATVAPPWAGDEPYQRSAPVLAFALLGLPISQGSKSFKGFTKNGRPIMAESAKGLKPWRGMMQTAIVAAIRQAPVPAAGWPLLGPVGIDLCFTMRRPVGAPKRRRTWPIVAPDIDKLVRASLDSAKLAGLFGDDSQVVDLHAWKVYPLETPRALRAPGLAAAVYLIDQPRATAGEQASLL
jgi:Holliday junction resolvase RusA-like endonuclease